MCHQREAFGHLTSLQQPSRGPSWADRDVIMAVVSGDRLTLGTPRGQRHTQQLALRSRAGLASTAWLL